MPTQPWRRLWRWSALAPTSWTSEANPRGPGSLGVSAETELGRILPVIERLRGKIRIPISVDTSKSEVAEAAAAAGAEIVNDVTALRNDPRIAEVARRRKLALVLMHMRGKPRTMQKNPFARDVLRDVAAGIAACGGGGAASGSGKIADRAGSGNRVRQKLRAELRIAGSFAGTRALGLSAAGGHVAKKLHRQEFWKRANCAPAPSVDRIWGTAATVAASILQGAHIVRVHDVAEMAQVAQVSDAVASPRLMRRS